MTCFKTLGEKPQDMILWMGMCLIILIEQHPKSHQQVVRERVSHPDRVLYTFLFTNLCCMPTVC